MGNYKSHIKTQNIAGMFQVQHLSMNQIQKLTGMSRAGIKKRLNAIGINTSKGKNGPCWVKYYCDFCGKESKTTRAKWRKNIKHYCSQACYFAAIENPGYHPWRQGQRLARAIITQYFNIPERAAIHHKDGNSRNNDLSNLAVYQTQNDHMKHHRNGKAKPIWED